MANSRLEKIGTIYTRARGLLESGARSWADRPLWYDIYEAFPPKDEPTYARPAPNITIKEIFYAEDRIRALLHNNIKAVGITNLNNYKTKSFTQKFIDTYQKIEKQYEGAADEDKIFKETLDLLKKEKESFKAQTDEDNLQFTAPTELRKVENKISSEASISLKIKDIFKD